MDSDTKDRLEPFRVQIDAIDAGLVALLDQRAQCSIKIGKIKDETGAATYQPGREAALLQKLCASNSGVLPKDHLNAIYREILSSSRALQRSMRLAFLGPQGTFSHMAALEHLGEGFLYVEQEQIRDIFSAVASGDCDLGIVPIENSVYGTIVQSLDYFIEYQVFVQAELSSRIRLSLLSSEVSLESVTKVYSHAQPLGQSAGWLRKHLPSAHQIPVSSTAEAAKRAAAEAGSAAVGHHALAERLGMHVLANQIEDISDNWTRFFVIGPQMGAECGAEKSSLLFTLANKPGSLSAVLECFANAGINMSKLESRPMRGERWKYIFFADIDCNITDKNNEALFKALSSHCHDIRVLGAYPASPRGNE